MAERFFSTTVQPDTEGLLACLRREGTPRRVFAAELMLDAEVQAALVSRFGLDEGIREGDPYAKEKTHAALMQFLGYESVRIKPEGIEFPHAMHAAADTAGLSRPGGRRYMDEARGPVTTWEEFEHYPWPDPKRISTKSLEWYEKNLPDGMCMATGGMAHICEYLVRLMGYETLCYALVESRDLVTAIRDKLVAFYREALATILTFPRVRMIWGGDDMGFRTATLLSPADLRELVFPGHALLARMAHEAGRPYVLHSCGNLSEVMEDLITGVGIDAKHSFEDAIQTMPEARRLYGSRIGLIGGIDVDFLCRATGEQVRTRTRLIIEECVKGGGWCLGTGNSVANYVPLDNYLAMLDEGRKFAL